jgi:hypothetical protein
MAFLHGKSASFEIDVTGGTSYSTTLSAYCDDVSISRSFETGETTTFGSSAKSYIMGLSDATISVSGKFDANGATSVDGLLGPVLGSSTLIGFRYKVSSAATSATNPAYTGNALLTSYDISSSVADVITFSAEFQVTGAVTRATS